MNDVEHSTLFDVRSHVKGSMAFIGDVKYATGVFSPLSGGGGSIRKPLRQNNNSVFVHFKRPLQHTVCDPDVMAYCAHPSLCICTILDTCVLCTWSTTISALG